MTRDEFLAEFGATSSLYEAVQAGSIKDKILYGSVFPKGEAFDASQKDRQEAAQCLRALKEKYNL